MLRPGERTVLAAAPFVHLYVADGSVRLRGEMLVRGDSARVRDEELDVHGRGELLTWSMRPDPQEC